MEDYKKNYEDSMKKIKRLHESVDPKCKQIIEYYFPELKESDDERIRKEIIDYINEREILERPTETRIKKEWVAWLEKQKQYPKLNESEDEKIGKQLLNWFKDCKWDAIDNETLKRDDILAWLGKRVEQKPAWSEEDKKMFRSSRCYLNEFGNLLSSKNEEKSLSVYKACDWLKSLKERYTWKPSDEQMDALNIFIGEANSYDTAAGYEEAEILASLYEQLKKLKGE